jgi:hypothetical protein
MQIARLYLRVSTGLAAHPAEWALHVPERRQMIDLDALLAGLDLE